MHEPKSALAVSQKARRERRQHNKTRSGCITCRRRHIKCDEGKPGCGRCASGRRRCEGYDTPVPWIFEPGSAKATLVFQPTSNTQEASTSNCIGKTPSRGYVHFLDHANRQSMPQVSLHRIPWPLALDVDWTERERKRFWLYMQLSHSTLEAFGDADAEFFCNVLPQASMHAPAIRSAVLCFASYIGSLIDPNNARDCQLAAEWHYRKILLSAGSVRTPSSDSSWVEVFIASMLLRCLETYRNDYNRVVTHLRGAIGIIKDHKSSTATQPLDLCVQHIINRVKAKMNSRSKFMSHSPMSPFAQFNSVVDGICVEFDTAGSLSAPRVERLNLIQKCVNQLDLSFPNGDVDAGSMSRDASRIYLHIQYQICRLVLLNLEDLRVLSESQSYPTFQNILDSCSKLSVLTLEGAKTLSSEGQQIRLGFGTEFISNLLFIATACGSRHIQQSAISLLRSCFRQEWLWDSIQAAQLAEWLIHQEDDHLSVGTHSSFLRPCISSAELFQEKPESVSSFRRPSWVHIELLWPDRTTKHWLRLDQPHRRAQSQTQTSPPSDSVLCCSVQGPLWPSSAMAISKSYVKLLQTSGAVSSDWCRDFSRGATPCPIYTVLGS